MKILIVEDDPNKRRRLAEFIKAEFPAALLVEQCSYQSGLEFALRNESDIILLDMSMPTYDVSVSERGGEMRAFGGREILRQLERKRIDTKVIIVTQFESFGEGAEKKTLDELRSELQSRFAPVYVGTVVYQPQEASWQEKLRLAIRKAMP